MARDSKLLGSFAQFIRTMAVVAVVFSSGAVSAAQVFWSDNAGIHRINTDGTARQDILALAEQVYGLSADAAAGKIYWTQGFDSPTTGIYRASFNGSNAEGVVVNLYTASGIGVDAAHNQFFWGGRPTNDDVRMYRSNLNGSGTQLVFSPKPDIDGLFVDSAAGKLYRLDQDDNAIVRSNLDGSNDELVASGNANMAVDLTGGKVYWTTGLDLFRANLDGTNPETVAASLLTDGNARNIALDEVGRKLYYIATFPTGGIFRSNLDGSQFEKFIDVPASINQILVVNAVPEPSSLVLGAVGLGLLLLGRRRCW